LNGTFHLWYERFSAPSAKTPHTDKIGLTQLACLAFGSPSAAHGNRGTSSFSRVRFFRAERGKTVHKTMAKYHAAAGEKRDVEMPNKAIA
jgi:hypothetical protein